MRTVKTDQTRRMPMLIYLRWAHSRCVGFVTRRLNFVLRFKESLLLHVVVYAYIIKGFNTCSN